METEKHYINRSGWLRAAILGANDGILSTTSIAIGVAAATVTRSPIILAALAGLVAGALSMAAGEYVSVSSQSDIETADLEREKTEIETTPHEELKELAEHYEERGLNKDLAMQVLFCKTVFTVALLPHPLPGMHMTPPHLKKQLKMAAGIIIILQRVLFHQKQDKHLSFALQPTFM